MSQTIDVNKIVGESPNEVWLRTGQVTLMFGVLCYVGFTGFGAEFHTSTSFGPFVLMSGGVLMMLYGTKLRKTKLVAEQAHALQVAKASSPAMEPTAGHDQFLEWIKPQLPITVAELRDVKFQYDEKRTKAELLLASRYHRIGFWTNFGTLEKYGDSYDLANKPDLTVIK
jgi:hypothetical protein